MKITFWIPFTPLNSRMGVPVDELTKTPPLWMNEPDTFIIVLPETVFN